MKKRLSSIYYVIPVIYIGVIAFFLYMQFHSRERFQEKIGNLVVAGTYSKTLSGARHIRDIAVTCNDIRLQFGGRSALIAGFGRGQERRIGIRSYSLFDQGLELEFGDELRLRFASRGELGSTIMLKPLIPAALKGLSVLSLPFQLKDAKGEAVRGIPLLRVRGKMGLRYAALPAGSEVDLKRKRLMVDLKEVETEPVVLFERVEAAFDEPYLYWFSRQSPLADEREYQRRVELFLERAYRYWDRVIVGTPANPAIAGSLGACLLSEAIRRGEYRRLLPVLSREIREILRQKPEIDSPFFTAAYLGDLQGFLARSQEEAVALIQRITESIRRSDPAVFETPELIRFIVNRAPFSLAEEIDRLADGVNRQKATAGTLLALLEVHVDSDRFFDTGQAVRQHISDLIDQWLLPAVRQTREGLFLVVSSEGAVELAQSVKAGRLFIQAAVLTARPSLAILGRNLILSALAMADSEGFVPARGQVRAGRFQALQGQLAPEELYALAAEKRFLPQEYPLYTSLSPGAWWYTAASPVQVKVDANQYRFVFSFPVGDAHYFLIQGIRPMQSVILHEILWKPDPQYFFYTDGWSYDEGTQTLFAKVTHRKQEEELVINY